MTASSSRGTLWAFLALSGVWGASFLFIKVGLQGLSPAQVVLGRILLGALALAVIMVVTRRRWPRDRRVWGHMLVVGVFFCIVPYTLFAWAEQYVPSSLASIYNATTPIMTLLLTPLVLPAERLGRVRTAGLIIGITGVVVLSGPWELIGSSDLAATVPAQLACLGATLSYGFSGLYLRRFVSGLPYDSISLSAVQLAMASLIALLLAPWDAMGSITLNVSVMLSIGALGVVGTGVAYVWYTRILREWGAARASTVTYLAPVVGVLLGVTVLGESIHWYEPVGGAVVVAGILVSQGMLRRRVPRSRRVAQGDRVAESAATTVPGVNDA
jgi:drug/metabolite transporter (DMT)-like permease